jgi:polyisoprenyl-phosphate glycosyltransferase
MRHQHMKLSIVIPVFQEERGIPLFLERIGPVLAKLPGEKEMIFCLDPCRDGSERVILEARQKDERVKLLLFSRRIGQPMATLAGLHYASGDAVIVMDVDLQDPPELILEMVRIWQEGADVVYAQRKTRAGEPLLRRVMARTAYWLMRRLADVPIPENTGDFRLMSRRVVDELKKLKEMHGFLRGLVALVGFKQVALPFDRPARATGDSHYPVMGSIKIGLNGLLCFSTAALRLSSILGFATAGFSLLLTAIYLVLKVVGFPISWGNPTMVILITFIGGIQLITIGILGEYIGRIYEEVRMRPRYIVDKAAGLPAGLET